MSDNYENIGGSDNLVRKWEPALEGINDNYTRKVTATLLENQAKSILAEHSKVLAEAGVGPGTTTVGALGTFQKFSMPIVRRVYPELIFNKLGATQPMQGPVSQVFYLGHTRHHGATNQNIYSKYNLTYRGMYASSIGSSSGTMQGTFGGGTASGLDYNQYQDGFDGSSVIRDPYGVPSSTFGGQIASWPDSRTTLGWAVSAGERLEGTGIPEISLHIQQQPVTARTRKMRALWTLEASQDLKAYHNLDLEQELTSYLSQELQLEIDRELIEDMRMIAYGIGDLAAGTAFGGWYPGTLDPRSNSNNFGDFYGKDPASNADWRGNSIGNTGFAPGAFEYDFPTDLASQTVNPGSNIFVVDLTHFQSGGNWAPQHVGHVYSNLLATLNFASQDIFRTTMRGPGTWLITSPLIASMLESAAKLEGGLAAGDGPTNMGSRIEFKGKFAGKYDLFVDPLFPTDEIMMGYKGSNPMDSGFVYCPYIPLMQLPTITDPESFQPRKGILTRYGKLAIQPASRFFRIIRVVGPTSDFIVRPTQRNSSIGTDSTLSYGNW